MHGILIEAVTQRPDRNHIHCILTEITSTVNLAR